LRRNCLSAKNSSKIFSKQLKYNPWAQSPISEEVKSVINTLSISDQYYLRGTKKATQDLETLEKKHREWISPIVSLADFPYVYAVAGATEAINHWILSDARAWQYLKGDYQWPNLISSYKGSEVNFPSNDKVLYISNPQCANGNFIHNKFLQSINCPVILDCAYLGATSIHHMEIPPNTEQIMFSFSKGWGLIGQRCGLLYTKQPHPTLHPLKKVECWNYNMVRIIDAIIKSFTPDYMFNRFREDQSYLCNKYSLEPSDTYFLATSKDEYYSIRRRRDKEARLCLTPLLKN